MTSSAPDGRCAEAELAQQSLPPLPEVRLSLAEVRLLLRALLPQPVFNLEAALSLLSYQQRRKAASYRSHRKRRLHRLLQPRTEVLSL
jgi:hypothetical protein